MQRKKIVAGNWKMNKTLPEGEQLIREILENESPGDVEVVIAPPAMLLEMAKRLTADKARFRVGAQNCHHEERGAYTGELAAEALASVGVDYVIVGHSERRQYFHETDALIAQKITRVLAHGMAPIYCCGEMLAERQAGTHFQVATQQLKEALFHLDAEDFKKISVAYEPVWAIGTGLTASPEQAQEMHHTLRKTIEGRYGAEIAASTSILYGGSCNPANARSLFSLPDVDGGLIGGASLKAKDFAAICNSF